MTTDYIAEHDGPTLAERQWWDQYNPEPEHRLDGFCWCQPIAEAQPLGGYVYIHRRSLDSPHIEED